MTTIEILQAAIDEGCAIEIERHAKNSIFCEIEGLPIEGWAYEDTVEKSIAAAWQHYQTNKQ